MVVKKTEVKKRDPGVNSVWLVPSVDGSRVQIVHLKIARCETENQSFYNKKYKKIEKSCLVFYYRFFVRKVQIIGSICFLNHIMNLNTESVLFSISFMVYFST